MRVDRERFRSFVVHSSSSFSFSVTRNLMTCVLLFGVSWCWELLGVDWTFVLVIVPPVCSITPRWSYVKHDTPLLFTPSGANHEQGLGWDSVCEAQRSNESPSGAFKRQRGLAQARWRGVAPTSATPTRSLRKCRRIAEVKSQWSTTFSRIENLWPRDGSCPLPLRSKRIFNKCFQIIKTQKISSGALLM